MYVCDWYTEINVWINYDHWSLSLSINDIAIIYLLLCPVKDFTYICTSFFLLFILARIISSLAIILWLPAIDNGEQKQRVFKTTWLFLKVAKWPKSANAEVAKLPPRVAKVPTRVAKSPSVAKTPNWSRKNVTEG